MRFTLIHILNDSRSSDSYLRLRKNVYKLFHAEDVETPAQHVTRLVIALSIFASISIVVLASVPEIEHSWGKALDAFEATVIVLFSTEYILRLWSITSDDSFKHPILGRIKYLISFLAVVDIIALLPLLAPKLLPLNLTFVRAIRLVVLCRVLTLGKYSRSMELINRVMKNKRHEIFASFFIIGLLIVCTSILMFYIEHPVQPKAFRTIPQSIWWAVAMMTTVTQYGDIFPITLLGKMCAVVVSLLDITAIGLPTGIIATGMMEEYQMSHVCRNCKSAFHRDDHPEHIDNVYTDL